MNNNNICVYNKIIISSIASKQQSDTILHKQEHGAYCSYGPLTSSIPVLMFLISGLFQVIIDLVRLT